MPPPPNTVNRPSTSRVRRNLNEGHCDGGHEFCVFCCRNLSLSVKQIRNKTIPSSIMMLDAVVPVSMLPGRKHLRSADNGLYDVPRVSSSVGSRAFSVAGPQAWNQLPASIRQMDCIATFKRHLKTSLLRKRIVCLINSLLLVKILFPLIFRLFLLYCILFYVILFCSSPPFSIVSGTIQTHFVIVIVIVRELQ